MIMPRGKTMSRSARPPGREDTELNGMPIEKPKDDKSPSTPRRKQQGLEGPGIRNPVELHLVTSNLTSKQLPIGANNMGKASPSAQAPPSAGGFGECGCQEESGEMALA